MITRRTLLENTARGSLALGAGGLIAACGSSSSSSSSSDPTGTPKHGGTLHAGLIGGSSSDTIDPNNPVNVTRLCAPDEPLRSAPWLDADAQQYLPPGRGDDAEQDATVWTIRLRKGLPSTTARTLRPTI